MNKITAKRKEKQMIHLSDIILEAYVGKPSQYEVHADEAFLDVHDLLKRKKTNKKTADGYVNSIDD